RNACWMSAWRPLSSPLGPGDAASLPSTGDGEGGLLDSSSQTFFSPWEKEIWRHMEIIWHGHAYFRIRGREGVVVTDPTVRKGNGSAPRTTADVVTISHAHPGHSQASLVGG